LKIASLPEEAVRSLLRPNQGKIKKMINTTKARAFIDTKVHLNFARAFDTPVRIFHY